MPEYEVVTPPPVRRLIDALAGKRAGYQRLYHQLEHDPCAPELGAYRLSGPLEPIVRDIWTILHDLFGVDNPPSDHDRPPCCERNMPEIDQDELDAFVEDLQRMVSGRRSPRRRRSSR